MSLPNPRNPRGPVNRPSRDRTGSRAGYLSEDTIAALASAVGGPIAVVRISGPGTFAALEKLLGAPVADFPPRTIRRAKLYDGKGHVLDDALISRFAGPASYTGEDVAELSLHGSALIASRVLKSLFDLGVRQALPGEFSFRAVRNGKMSLSQAQAVSDLITASNAGAAELALEKLEGSQARAVGQLAGALRDLAARSELGIDFSDQDVDELSLSALKAGTKPLLDRMREIEATFERGSRIQEGVSVALVGVPNAGKSSFFNALLGEDRSIVTEVEGTTRDVVRERLTLTGSSASVTFRLEDTAGLRDSEDQVERIGIQRTREAVLKADVVLWVIDASGELASARAVLADATAGKRAIGVLTKWDLTEGARREEVLREVASWPLAKWVPTSARTGEGISAAADAMLELARDLVERDPGELVITRLDHLEALGAAALHLERAENAQELDLFAADIRQALYALAPIIGETLPDDILGKIFSEFCIGK